MREQEPDGQVPDPRPVDDTATRGAGACLRLLMARPRPPQGFRWRHQALQPVQPVSTPVVVRRASMSGQHVVETEAGSAVLTRLDLTGPRGGRVFDYEIETAFKGDRVRLHYGYASFAAARNGVQQLADNHMVERFLTALEPRRDHSFDHKDRRHGFASA